MTLVGGGLAVPVTAMEADRSLNNYTAWQRNTRFGLRARRSNALVTDLCTNTDTSIMLYNTATDVPHIVTALDAHNTPLENLLCSDSTRVRGSADDC